MTSGQTAQDRAAGLSRAFIVGGRAIFTVSNETSGERYTYRINGREGRANPNERTYFIGLLTGPQNDADYTYLGILDPATFEVRLTAKSRFRADSKPVQVVAWALRHVAASRALPVGYALRHAGRCGVCGRTLTTPESIETGIGPVCLGL